MEDNEFDLEQKVKDHVNTKKSKDFINDEPHPENDKTPPPGWKKKLNPFADNTFIPPGWRKVGDTYAGPEDK